MKDLHGIIAGIIVFIIFKTILWGGLPLIGYLIIMSFAALFSFELGAFILFSLATTIAVEVWSGTLRLLKQGGKEIHPERNNHQKRDRDPRVFDHDNYKTSTEVPAFKVQSGFDVPVKKEKAKRANSTFSVAAVRASKPARKEVSTQQIEHKSTFNIAAVRASKVA